MEQELTFAAIGDQPRGTLLALLRDAYGFDARFSSLWDETWQATDAFYVEHPQLARFGFVTLLGAAPIGFLVWDPRKMPEAAEIGYNCIASAYKGRGFGKKQLQEAVTRIKQAGARKILVTTDDILLPAQRMYESVGFVRVGTRKSDTPGDFVREHIDYEYLI